MSKSMSELHQGISRDTITDQRCTRVPRVLPCEYAHLRVSSPGPSLSRACAHGTKGLPDYLVWEPFPRFRGRSGPHHDQVDTAGSFGNDQGRLRVSVPCRVVLGGPRAQGAPVQSRMIWADARSLGNGSP